MVGEKRHAMKYIPPLGSTDPDAPYVNGDPATGKRGSIVPADAFNHVQAEIINAIEASGQTPSADNLKQLAGAFTAAIKPSRYRWTLGADVAANAETTIPSSGHYTVGKGAKLWYLGLYLTEGTHWESVGVEGTKSNKIKLLFSAEKGDECILETPQ